MNYCWILLLMIHCSRGQDRYKGKCLNREEVIPKKYLIMKDESLPIQLDTSSRITHQLSTHIFKIYITEVLGYPKVVINNYEDDFQIEEVMDRLSETENKVPPATINLEVWASADYDTLAKELVKESGSVAAPGRFGWFVPLGFDTPIREYYQRYRWNDAIREVHWSFFSDPKFAARFDIDNDVLESLIEANSYNREHAENGEYVCPPSYCKRSMYVPSQCKMKSCAVLLAPQFNGSRFLIDQIEETDLLVKVLWLGDNLKKTLSDLKHAYQMSPKKGILIFHWYPSDIVPYQEKFISVQFKNNELYNFTYKNTTGFKYEIQRLVKMSWGKVQNYAYPLYVGLRHFKLEEKDFHWLLSTYNGFPGMSIEQIACEWMKNNNDTWERWKVTTRKATLYIGGIFPISSTSYNGSSILQASHLASQAVNRNGTILPDYDLKVLGANGKCSPDTVMNEFINFVRDHEYYSKLVGVLGPACSETVEPIAGVSKHYHIIVISYSAEGSSFSDRKTYPYFFRTIGENQHYKHVYLSLFKYFHWQRVAALTEDGQKYTEYIALMQEDFKKHQIEFIANKKFPREKKSDDMRWHLEDLKNKRARIIIADVVDDAARTLMCEAYKLEMTAKQGYVWFLPVWLNKTWYDTDLFNVMKKDNVNCTTKEMIEAINGYFSLTHSYYAPDETMMQENMSVGMWRKKHYNMVGGSPYAGFAYDAVWTYALALDKLASADSEAMSTLHSENSTNKLVRLIEATDFQGVSGRIKFRGGPSRFSVINIMQWYNNESHLVGYFNPTLTENKPEILGGFLQLNNSAVMWFTKDRSVPEDGNLPPPSCAVESLANAFDVECQTAMIILNVIVAGVLLIIVVAVCYYMKREYDKKVERTKNYIRSLGLTLEINYTDLDKWEVSRQNVVINRKLGEGAFGTVYGGEALLPERGGWMAVAVKTLKVGSSSVEKLDFLSEAEAMKRFNHKNIVTLLGVCTKDEPVYTIMEFMLYGDLKVYLLGRRNLVNSKDSDELEEVSAKRLTNMALDVALGLKYLSEMKFVHRDIASRNCLVNAQRCVKIGDFGMTRAMFENDYYKFTRKGMLPVRWMSPESLDSGVFSSASDMWSYGVLLYEIITFGSFPFQGKNNAEVLDLVKDKQTLSVPKGAKPLLEGLMKSCWRHDPKERPTAAQVVDLLANNPRLLSPCLDAPTSSVPIEHDQLGMSPQKDAKIVSPSKSMNGALIQASKSIFEDRHETEIPLEVCCPKEPLLGPTSTSNLLTLGSRKETKHDEKDDYVNQHLTVRKQNTNV